MKRFAGIVVGVWMSAAVAIAGAAAAKPSTAAAAAKPSTAAAAAKPSTAVPPAPSPEVEPKVYVVAHRKAALHYGKDQIGELPEATRVKVVRKAGEWSQVRAEFGDAWIVGWVSSRLIEPDSLAKVDVKIGRTAREYSFERRTLPGFQFLIIRVQFAAREGGPSRVYLEFGDLETADLYLVHSRDKRVLPHGFMRREPMSERRTFETAEKRQILELKPGKPLVETYVFAIPQRAKGLVLVLKDIKRPVRVRR